MQSNNREDRDDTLSRRDFVQILGAGLLLAATASPAIAQIRGREQRSIDLGARLHIGKDGIITVMTGKVECGQGARAEITQAAAEELHVGPDQIQVIMADTALTPDDGITAGSRTTPLTLPVVRQGCAAAYVLLVKIAAARFGTDVNSIKVQDGIAIHENQRFTYSDLAAADEAADAFKKSIPRDVTVTPVDQWKVLGSSLPRPNRRDIVAGAHHYPSDIIRPGMLYGKILRPPSYQAELKAIDLSPAKKMDGVIAIQDGNFVGVAATSTYLAKRAIQSIETTAQWIESPQPSSREIFEYLRDHAKGGVPQNPFENEIKSASKVLRAKYEVSYVQHVPLEPRAAVAEWDGNRLTVWTGSQNPFGVRGELANAFSIPEDHVRVIIPDFGGGFGGKHTGETAVEAARLAKAAGKPVALRWTRTEEFTWASFRPAAAIDVQATLDAKGNISSWHFVNINSGNPGIESPYRIENKRSQYVESEPPLRHGSYRGLASTANNFARESFMDELSSAAGRDPLEFRLAHLDDPRLRAVLEAAAKNFGWQTARQNKAAIGLACATEKGSYVAACVEITVDQQTIRVKRICQAFECGAIINPQNLRAQVTGGLIMGLGPALREAVEFANGKIANASLWKYHVPRFEDLPQIDVQLLDRKDLPSTGAGETPLIVIAPAIANAVYQAIGKRVRQMPILV